MKQSLKFIVTLLLGFFLRLIPFRPANFEPIMGSMMPFAKRYGALTSGLFGFASIVLYDLVTKYGAWTWETAITYGLISVWAASFFQKRDANRGNFVAFALMGTLVYDFITGPLLPTLLHHGNFMALTIAQIPFTLSHLAGNLIFAAVVSPVLMKYVILNPYWDLPTLKATNQKTA
jgi:uncharacterized membrane protein